MDVIMQSFIKVLAYGSHFSRGEGRSALWNSHFSPTIIFFYFVELTLITVSTYI